LILATFAEIQPTQISTFISRILLVIGDFYIILQLIALMTNIDPNEETIHKICKIEDND